MATSTAETQATGETMKKIMDTMNPNMAPGFENLMKANAQAGQMWMDGCSKIGQELMSFTNARLAHDLEVLEQLSTCRDPFQAMRVQAECVQKAAKDYMDEVAKLADIATDAGVNGFKQIDEGVREVAEQQSKAAGKAA